MKKTLYLLFFLMMCNYGMSQIEYIDRLYQGLGGVNGIISPSSISKSPDDKHVYVIGNRRTISKFAFNKQSQELGYMDCMIEGDNGVEGIYGIFQMDFSPDGKFSYAVSIDSSSIIVFDRDTANGSLEIIQTIKNDSAKNCLTSLSNILLTKNGKFAYSVSKVSNKIGVFSRNPISGHLTFVDTVDTYFSDVEYPSSYGYFISSSYDSRYLYSASNIDAKIITYQIDTITGNLAKIQELDNTNLFGVYYTPSSIIHSPDGRFVYAPCRGNRIILLHRNINTGLLTPFEEFALNDYTDVIGINSNINYGVITKDNDYLLTAIDLSDIVIKLKIDSSSGSLSTDTIIYNPGCTVNPYNRYLGDKTISLSNDDKMIFTISSYDDNIMLVGNNVDSTGLNLLNTINYGDNGLNSFNNPLDFIITDNQKYVYVISGEDSVIHSFTRDKNTGTLMDQNTVIKDSYLKCSNASMSMSDDNKNIYLCTYANTSVGSSVNVFSIDTVSGNMILEQSIPNNDSDVYGPLSFYDIGCSNDNRYVYAISENDFIKIYSRNLSTGQLSFLNNFTVQPIGAASYFGAHKILFSKDDKFIYLVSDQGIKVLSKSSNGQLATIQTIRCSDYYWGYAADAKLSEDQSSLFIVNSDAPYLIEYIRNSVTGRLTYFQKYLEQNEPILSSARSMHISKDKSYIYIGGYSSSILVTRLNPNNNIYERIKLIKGIALDFDYAAYTVIKASPDERSLYACSSGDKTILNLRPRLSLGEDLNACIGDKVVLSGYGNYTSYNWSTGGSNDTVIVSATNTYRLSATNSFGEIEIDSIYVQFNPLPIVDLGADTTICNGEAIKLSSDKDFESYLWNTGSTSKNIITYNPGKYVITVTDSVGCTNSDSVSIGMHPAPNLIVSDVSLCYGSTVDISANGCVSYVWNNSDTSNVITVNPLESTMYFVTGTDTNNCTITKEVIATVFAIPPPPLVTGVEDKLQSSNRIGNQWYMNNTMLDGDTNQYLTPIEEGHYYVIVTENDCVSDKSNVIKVIMTDLNQEYINLDVEIYPNPANDKITLLIPEALNQGNVTILTSNGIVMLNKQINDAELKLDISSLPQGLYFIKLLKGNTTLIRKFIKN